MEMIGEQVIPVKQDVVWAALNDPEVLKLSIPGCESIERVSEVEYRAVVGVAIGPVKAKFNGKLLLSDMQPPTAYALSFEGTGGAAGFAKGGAQVNLVAEGASTRLQYRASAQIGGKLAQVGSRLVDGVAKKMADEFFRRFSERLTGAPAPAGGATSAAARGAGAATLQRGTAGVVDAPWLAGTWGFFGAFVVTFVLIWVFR